MFEITGIEGPIWFGDPRIAERGLSEDDVKAHNLSVVAQYLDRWNEALTLYSGKTDKPTAKVDKIVEAISEDESTVALADETMQEVRALILNAVLQDVRTTYLLFRDLDDVKKAVGSWRSDVNVTVTNDDTDEDDRDLISEYEALDKGRVMIEGTFNAFGLDVLALPEKYRAQKSERVNGKNVKTNEWYLKFPGKLVSPLNETETVSTGKVPTSFMYTWVLNDGDVEIGKASFPYLARVCSTPEVILSVDDLMTSIKAKHGDNFSGVDTIEVRTPRGILKGTKVKK